MLIFLVMKFEYTWGWFEASIKFWKEAAEEKRYVLFTADQ